MTDTPGEQPKSPSPSAPGLGDTTVYQQDTPSGVTTPPANINASEWIGKTIGKYRITGFLGQGGMGVVLKGHDPLIQRDVAIKLLAPHLAADEVALNRFLGEARSAGKLNHANVCAIYEIGRDGALNFLAIEFVPGGSLGDKLDKGGALSVLEATRAMIDICKGVAAAHSAGLIHRDIKPANFLRAADGSVKVSDFGLAKQSAGNLGRLTHAGLVIGTPFFMSPEQCEGKLVDNRSDIYSLGASYYSLLTGRNPFHDSESLPRVMYNHCHGPIPNPCAVNPAVPEACGRIVACAMAKLPLDRYQTAQQMLADLEVVAAALSGQHQISLPSETTLLRAAGVATVPIEISPKHSRRVPWFPVAIAAIAIASLVLFLWRPWDRRDESPAQPPAAAGDPVRVGVLHSLSGTMSVSETVVVDAVLFAIDEVNQSGGVLGRPLKAVVADGRSDWPTFAREAERLITGEKVAVVFGCWTSASRKTVIPIFEQHDHLLIYPVQYEGVETSPCVVYMGAAPNQQIIPAVEWAIQSRSKKRFFLVGSDYVFPRTANEVLKDQIRKLGGEIVGEKYIPLGSADVGGVVAAVKQSKPDMILNTINGDTNVAFFRALRAAGITPQMIPTMSFSIGEQELRSLNAADTAGDYAAWTYFQSVDTPENRDFVNRFHEKFPQRSVTDPMEAAYVGVHLWARAVNEAQSLDPKSVRRAMLNQRWAAPEGPVRVDADTQHCYNTPRIGRIRDDGQFEILWTAPAPVRPQPFPPSRSAADWRVYLHDLHAGWGNQWSAPK